MKHFIINRKSLWEIFTELEYSKGLPAGCLKSDADSRLLDVY